MMQGMPQYTKEIQMYLNHMHIIDDCQKQFQNNVEKLCKGILLHILRILHKF